MFLFVDHELDGRQAGDRLHRVAVTVDRNAVPFDPRPPTVSGTGALADRHPLDAEVPA